MLPPSFQSDDSGSNTVFPGQTLNSSELGNKISQVSQPSSHSLQAPTEATLC